MKKLFSLGKGAEKKGVEGLLDVYSDLKEVAEKLCDRIDNKINELKELEKRIDNKIEEYKRLITKTEINRVSKNSYDKRNEVVRLYLSGEEPAKIAKLLNLPLGEVELLINLYKIKSSEK